MDSGSPIAARLDFSLFGMFVVALLALAVIVILWLISLKLESYRKTGDYAEKRKDKPTSKKEINELSKRARLSRQEKELFTKICHAHPLPNINYVLTKTNSFDTYLKETFTNLDSKKDEEGKTTLFSLRTKAFSAFETTLNLKNTRLIPVETPFTYTPSQGIHHVLVLTETNPQEMHFRLPPEMTAEDKPEILSKIKLIFVYKDNNPYEIEARVARYQKGKNDSEILVCAQTDRISSRTRRASPRMELFMGCTFSSAKKETAGGKTEFKTSEKLHDGSLLDISAGGCRISTKLPIKAEQYLHINSTFGLAEKSEATGIILRTTKTKNEDYILHIKFVKISQNLVNRINALTCGYAAQ